MQPEKVDSGYLWDMWDAAKAIEQFTASKTFHDYFKDRMLRGAVERHLEIIGEAARKISQSFKDAHPEITWHRLIAQRNVLAHEYGEIKHELMWKVVTLHIPDLIAKLESLISPTPPISEDKP